MQTVYSLQCMMCGRSSGQVRNGVFHRADWAPPLRKRNGRHWCGFCGGNVYLEFDDSGVLAIERSDAAQPLYQEQRAS